MCVSYSKYQSTVLQWQGAWRSILEAIKGQQIADQEQLLGQAAYYTLALIKLRNYPAANAELLKLGDLDAAHLSKSADDGKQSILYAVPVMMCACLHTHCHVLACVPSD